MGEIYNNGSRCAYLSGSALEVVRTDTHFFDSTLCIALHSLLYCLAVFGFCVDFHLWCKKRFLVVAVCFLLTQVRHICVYKSEVCIFFSVVFFCVYSEECRFCAVIVFCHRPAGACSPAQWPLFDSSCWLCGRMRAHQDVFFFAICFWSKIYVFFTCIQARPTRLLGVQCPGGTAAGG